jgi:hypothetical protein
MRGKRLLTVTSCVFATGSFVMFCVALGNENMDVSNVNNIFDVTFSVILPLITPWLLVMVSPKQQPLRTLFECTPFVFSLCFSFVLFFLATRGQISTIVHAIQTEPTTDRFSVEVGNTTQPNLTYDTQHNITYELATPTLIDVEIHSDVNASLHFDLDIFTTTSVDSAGNIPMLLFAPLVKIPTIVVVLANVINRSNLVVITSLLVTMSLREMYEEHTDTSTHRAYCVALTLSIISLICNVVKYMRLPSWVVAPYKDNTPNPSVNDIDLEEYIS